MSIDTCSCLCDFLSCKRLFSRHVSGNPATGNTTGTAAVGTRTAPAVGDEKVDEKTVAPEIQRQTPTQIPKNGTAVLERDDTPATAVRPILEMPKATNDNPRDKVLIEPRETVTFSEGSIAGTDRASKAGSLIVEVTTSCWFIAREKFLQEDGKLWHSFECVLTETSTINVSADTPPRPLVDIMRNVVDQQIKRINSRAWTVRFPFRERPTEIRSIIQRLVEFAKVTKPVWSAASGVDPLLVGLPLGGLAVLVELIGNAKTEHDALLKGVDLVTDLVLIYWEVERKVATNRLTALLTRLHDALTDLYVAILRFLASASTTLHTNTAIRTASDTIKRHNWKSQVEDIDQRHQKCERLAKHLITATAWDEGLIERMKEVVDKALDGTKQKIEQIKNSLQAEQKMTIEVLNWVSSVDVGDHHETVRGRMGEYYAKRSGARVREVVDAWLRSETPTFWLTGSVGTGKSSLVSTIVEWLYEMNRSDSGAGLAFFYCVRSETGSAVEVLRSLVAQLSWEPDGFSVAEAVRSRYKKVQPRSPSGDRRRLTAEDCCQLIGEELAPQFLKITIIIDALDECEDYDVLLSSLSIIYQRSPDSCSIKILLSSRNGVELPATFPPWHRRDLDSEQNLTRDDLERLIQTEVEGCDELNLGKRLLDGKYPELENRLVEALKERAQGGFQWTKLHLAAILRGPMAERPRTEKDAAARISALELGKTISQLPDLKRAYDQAYTDNTGSTVNSWAATLARRAYRIVLAAKRDLSIDAVVCAIRHEDEDENDQKSPRPVSDVPDQFTKVTQDMDESVDAELIQKLCSNFLVCGTDGTFKFAHVSVRDYLLQRPEEEYAIERCHAQMAASCIRCLLVHFNHSGSTASEAASIAETESGGMPDSSTSFHSTAGERADGMAARTVDLEAVPGDISDPAGDFVESGHIPMTSGSASSSTASHANVQSKDDFLEYALLLWADHFAESQKHRSSGVLARLLKDFCHGTRSVGGVVGTSDSQAQPLLLNWLHDLGSKSPSSLPAKIRDAMVDPPTPLVLASIWGIADIFEYTSEADKANASHVRTQEGATLLSLAARYQSRPVPIVERMLQLGCPVDTQHPDTKRTALLEAAYAGHEEVLQYLLRQGADINVRDAARDSLLSTAASHCDLRTVKLVLEVWLREDGDRAEIHEAAVRACDRKDDTSGSLISMFLAQTQSSLVRENLNSQSRSGRYAVVEAVKAGNRAAFTVLLECSVNPNVVDGTGAVPLQICGDTSMARALLQTRRIKANVDFTGGIHGSAVHAAIQNNQIPMLELLAEFGADLNLSPRPSGTEQPRGPPLFFALSVGREEVALWLLEMSGTSPTADSSRVSSRRRVVDVNMVMSEDMFPNPDCCPSCSGFPVPRTALQVAIWKKRDIGIIRRLLDCKARTFRPSTSKNRCTDANISSRPIFSTTLTGQATPGERCCRQLSKAFFISPCLHRRTSLNSLPFC
ncbi:hypothetical protein QBC47DRAFT_130878 [Echria macrotheca]|uniref:NACHT domain-containing protein n=1 Tax=Echria macrotheca TaxID=438768 RepID=A0AAJ0B152_9PEZI|nr:hypothetical protein QBC47DRAFT_130878 [Echria macrotheca]